jgi:uncharacterized protein YkwD
VLLGRKVIGGAAAAGVSLLTAGGVVLFLEPGSGPAGGATVEAVTESPETTTGPAVETATSLTAAPTDVPATTAPVASTSSALPTSSTAAGATARRAKAAARGLTTHRTSVSTHRTTAHRTTAATKRTTSTPPRATTRTTSNPKPSNPTPSNTTPSSRTTTSTGGISTASYEAQLLSLVNAERTARGLPALKAASCPDGFAESWAKHLASTGAFAHQSLSPIMRSCGATRAAENIARGGISPSAMVKMWMGSSGHRANILDPKLTHVGTAAVRDSSGTWTAVQDFIRS